MTEQLDHISQVNLYPIKSCQAATVEGSPANQLELDLCGPMLQGFHDRGLLLSEVEPLADGSHLFISQRGWNESMRVDRGKMNDSVLATVQTDISKGVLTISSAIGSLELAPAPDNINVLGYSVKMFESTLKKVIKVPGEGDAYFSELLGRHVQLGQVSRLGARAMAAKYHRPFSVNRFLGADGAPVLLTSEASLAQSLARNDMTPDEANVDRYRGNVVIDGTVIGPYGEDKLREIVINDVRMFIVKACARCPIPNIDQQTGERSGGGLKALRGRSGVREQGGKRNVFFGQNVTYDWVKGAALKVGDAVHVIEAASEPNFIPDTV